MFEVPGEAKPKGSTKSFVRRGRIITTSTTKDLKSWEQAIYLEAKQRWGCKPSCRQFSVGLDFYFARPKKPKWPYPPLDLDKLCRAAIDGMTGAIWEDDRHVVNIVANKCWDETSRLEIEVLER